MAHVHNRLKKTVSRCLESLADLRAAAKDDAQLAVVEACVDVVRKAQADVHDRIAAAEAAQKPKPKTRQAQRPDPAPAPAPAVAVPQRQYGPDAGVYEAKDKRAAIVGEARNFTADADMQRVCSASATPAEQLAEYLADVRGSFFECQAAREMDIENSPAWQAMDAAAKVEAIKARGWELHLADMNDAEREHAPEAQADSASSGGVF